MPSMSVTVSKTRHSHLGWWTSYVKAEGSTADERQAVGDLLQKEGYRPLPSSEYLLALGQLGGDLTWTQWTTRHTRSESGDVHDLAKDLTVTV
jgi:hypothetical protein